MEFDPAALPPNEPGALLLFHGHHRRASDDRVVFLGRANLVLGRIVYVHVHDIFEMKRPNPDGRG